MAGDSLTAPRQISTLETSDFLADVIAGFSSSPRTLPCKYFYDERGAALFQKICELPEYYITRTEIDILIEIARRSRRISTEYRADRTRYRRRHQNPHSDRIAKESSCLHPC
jgi:uncharacterized SAM-dependent methyltransferase